MKLKTQTADKNLKESYRIRRLTDGEYYKSDITGEDYRSDLKTFKLNDINVIYAEEFSGEEKLVRDFLQDLIDNGYDEVIKVKEINLAYDEGQEMIIDGEVYQSIGGRLYGSYGKADPNKFIRPKEEDVFIEGYKPPVKEQVKKILDGYYDEKTSKIDIFEINDKSKSIQGEPWWIEHFDDGDIDFSQFVEHKQKDYDNKSTGDKYYSFMISGGLNGSGDWEVYLNDIKNIFRDFKKELNLVPVLYKTDTDIADDVWTAEIFLYEKPTEDQLKECLLRTLEEDIEKHDELIYKVAEKLKNNINSFEDELITLSQIEGVDVEEIKQRDSMQIAKALVEEDIVDFRMFEDIEKHDNLNPKLFDDEELKPEVKETIQKISNEFIQELANDGIKFSLKDIILLGSNVSYNYTKDSDLDIHLIADSSNLTCPDNLYPLLYSAYRSLFNKNYNIKIKDIPAEIYVEMDEPAAISNGIYSLNRGWIKKPTQSTIPNIDQEAFDKLFKEWEDKYFALIEKGE